MEHVTIIEVMGDVVRAREESGLVRDFSVKEVVARAMKGVHFECEPALHKQIFKSFAEDLMRQ